MEGWWLSPDASLLAFEEVDERGVPTFTIPHHVPDPHASETHRYPFAGADNPRARLGIVKVRGRAIRGSWLKMPEQKHPGTFAAWCGATRNSFVQTQSRRQDEVRLLAVDAASARATLPHRARDQLCQPPRLSDPLGQRRVRVGVGELVQLLAVHEADGKRRVALTSGAWVVDSTACRCSTPRARCCTLWATAATRRSTCTARASRAAPTPSSSRWATARTTRRSRATSSGSSTVIRHSTRRR